MKKIISLLVLILMFISCNKDKTHILKGRLIYDCNTPVPNTEVELKTGLQNSIYRYYGTSDENGYFSIVYEKGNTGTLRINKDRILEGIPLQIGKEYDLGDVYVGGTIDLIVKLQVNNPHTENDTLFYSDLGSNDWAAKIAIPGPFTTGVVDTFIDGHLPSNFSVDYGELPKLNFGYYFSTYDGGHYFDINYSFCNMNEITFIID